MDEDPSKLIQQGSEPVSPCSSTVDAMERPHSGSCRFQYVWRSFGSVLSLWCCSQVGFSYPQYGFTKNEQTPAIIKAPHESK